MTRVCLPDVIHLKVACSEVSWFEREAKRAQRLMAELFREPLCKSVFPGVVCELPVQVEKTVPVSLVVETIETAIVSHVARAVGADDPFGWTIVRVSPAGSAWCHRVLHAFLHHHFPSLSGINGKTTASRRPTGVDM